MSIYRQMYLHFSFPQEALEAQQLHCLPEELQGGLRSIFLAPDPPAHALPLLQRCMRQGDHSTKVGGGFFPTGRG